MLPVALPAIALPAIAVVGLKSACRRPHYMHYAVAYVTYYLALVQHPELLARARTLSAAPCLQIERCDKKTQTLYVVFAGCASLTNTSKYLAHVPRDACSMIVLQAAFKQVFGLPHEGWFEDTMGDIHGIIQYIRSNRYTEIIGVGVSLGGLAASYFAKLCFLKVDHDFTFFYVGQRTLNSDITALKTINLSPTARLITAVCRAEEDTEKKRSRTTLSNLKAAYRHSSKSKVLKIGFVNGKRESGDWLAGAAAAVGEWAQETLPEEDYLAVTVNGGHTQYSSAGIQKVLKYLGNASNEWTRRQRRVL